MLLDSTTNRYSIPPLHDLGVIVWLQGVAPTARWTAATSGASPGGEESERGLTQRKKKKHKPYVAQLITAQ